MTRQSAGNGVLRDCVSSVCSETCTSRMCCMCNIQDKLVYLYSEHACFTPFLKLAGSGVRQVTSARDTPLMHLVAPLIAGNARTFLLAAVSSHPNSYLETVNTLRIAIRAQKIQVNEEHISHTHTNHAHIVHCISWEQVMNGVLFVIVIFMTYCHILQ